MKSIKLYLSLALAALIGMSSCSDKFDTPPIEGLIPEATWQANTSLRELKAELWKSTSKDFVTRIGTKENGEHYIVKLRVVSNDQSGNIYKYLFAQEQTTLEDGTVQVTPLAFSINSGSLYNEYRPGQEILLDLTGVDVGTYHNLFAVGANDGTASVGRVELAPLKEHIQANGLPDPSKTDTLVMSSFADLSGSMDDLYALQGRIVRLTEVTWAEADGKKEYTDASEGSTSTVNRTLKDAHNNTLTVRNSPYSDFATEVLPTGVGEVTGILSYYGTGWQLLLNSASDVKGFEPVSTKGQVDDPYSVDEAVEVVGKNKTGWVKGYIVGAVAPGVNEVKSNSDIQWEAPAALANTLVIGQTADTKDIAHALVVTLPDGSLLRTVANLVDNPTALGKEISIYGAIEPILGTPGISTTGLEGTFAYEGYEPPKPVTGSGTKEDPYGVSQVIGGSATGTAWVQGYIVGWVDGMTLAEGAKFTVPATSATNLLIADAAGETDVAKCIPVQLPTGAIRTALNLKDHPENLGKLLNINGSIEKYFGTTGVKSATAYQLDGVDGGGDTPTPTPTPSDYTSILDLKLTTEANFNLFTINDVEKPAGIDYVWGFDSRYGAKASAYVSGTRYKTESWLISPDIDVANYSSALFNFHFACNFFSNFSKEMFVKVSTDGGQTWTDVEVPNAPKSGSWTFMDSGDITVDVANARALKVAFVYTSTTSTAATWEIDQFRAFGK